MFEWWNCCGPRFVVSFGLLRNAGRFGVQQFNRASGCYRTGVKLLYIGVCTFTPVLGCCRLGLMLECNEAMRR